jgi:hypothetical protein
MLCLPYYACVFSSTKLVIRAEQDLPGTEWGERGEGGGSGQSGEMTQTIYARVNKLIKNYILNKNPKPENNVCAIFLPY